MAFDLPTISVTLSRRLNLGKFESADCSISISRLPFDADEETIQRALDTSNLAFSMMRDNIREKIAAVRQEHASHEPGDH